MSGPVEYAAFSIDLSSAGSEVISQRIGLFAFIRAEDSGGTLQLDAKIEVALGDETDDFFPMSVGQRVKAEGLDKITIKWDAQASVVKADFFTSIDPALVDLVPEPAAKLIVGSTKIDVGNTITSVADVVLVGLAATQILAAKTTRREAIITNLAANIRTMRIADSNAAAARGIPLAPGETIILTTTAAIHGFKPVAGNESVAVIEIED